MIPQIPFEASEDVRAAIEAIGRTEDLRFSPDNSLLAIAGYFTNRCLILRTHVAQARNGPRITVDDFMTVSADTMNSLHGIDFVDNETLAVANREGIVSILRLPGGSPGGRHCHVEPVRDLRGSLLCRIRTPGSLAARPAAKGRVELLVCNNYRDRVSRHLIDPRAGYRAVRNRKILKAGLKIPDGITVSHDGHWIAVSSHGTHDIKIYDATRRLTMRTRPVAVLSDANYPHGLRFTPGDSHLLVADAGGQVIFVFEKGTSWAGDRPPARTVKIMDDEMFARGRINIMDGGPKGLDIDRAGTVVALTCDQQPLAFFALGDMIA